MMMSMCDSCISKQNENLESEAVREAVANTNRDLALSSGGHAPAVATAKSSELRAERGSEAACILIGLTLSCVGAYFLFNPTDPDSSINVVNTHRLYLGQTAFICGAIFLAVGIRPR
jgi:hypothetical protein